MFRSNSEWSTNSLQNLVELYLIDVTRLENRIVVILLTLVGLQIKLVLQKRKSQFRTVKLFLDKGVSGGGRLLQKGKVRFFPLGYFRFSN